MEYVGTYSDDLRFLLTAEDLYGATFEKVEQMKSTTAPRGSTGGHVKASTYPAMIEEIPP